MIGVLLALALAQDEVPPLWEDKEYPILRLDIPPPERLGIFRWPGHEASPVLVLSEEQAKRIGGRIWKLEDDLGQANLTIERNAIPWWAWAAGGAVVGAVLGMVTVIVWREQPGAAGWWGCGGAAPVNPCGGG